MSDSTTVVDYLSSTYTVPIPPIYYPSYPSTTVTTYNPVYPYGTAITNYPTTVNNSYYDFTPNSEQIKNIGVDALVERMVTKIKKDDIVVICVDNDATTEQLREIANKLSEQGIKGTVIRGARAGTGFPYKGKMTDEDKRVDILARIGELWASRPDLALTDMLKWYTGEDMTDDAFAVAVEVHFKKVANGVSSHP
jgi:hypothetical protein